MKTSKIIGTILVIVLLYATFTMQGLSCSTFMLKKGNELLCGHNLNQPGMDVPGMIYINKRGIYKLGRTLSELYTPEKANPSNWGWISKYGSVTFGAFGRDFPDGGMNEAGLYIWEMSSDATYPAIDSLPGIMHMNWMQYILDNTSNVDDAIECAYRFNIDGWEWHYFIGDAYGNCASIDFLNGTVIIHQDKSMPVPGLYNLPYEKELDLLKYYQGYGGFYEIDLSDIQVPRIAKTAAMLEGYTLDQNAVDYAFYMLNNLKVYEVPDWSVVFDVKRKSVHYRTSKNQSIKHFSFDDFDFSNSSPVLSLDINGGAENDVSNMFTPTSTDKIKKFLENLPLPSAFFTRGGLTADEFFTGFAKHWTLEAQSPPTILCGQWRISSQTPLKNTWSIAFSNEQEAVIGTVILQNYPDQIISIDNLNLQGNRISFSFHQPDDHSIVTAYGEIIDNQMSLHIGGMSRDKFQKLVFDPFYND